MRMRLSREEGLTTGVLFAATTIWGLVPVATRYLLASFTPLQLVIVRFLIAAIFFLPLLVPLRKQRWSFKEVAWALFCGLVGVIGYYVLVAYGQQLISAGMAGLLLATQPIWILLISTGVTREKISWPVLSGLVIALSGIALLLSQETLGAAWNVAMFMGALLVLLAALMWSFYTVAVRSLSQRIGARASTALTMLLGALPLSFFWDGRIWGILLHLSIAAWLALGLLSLGSTVVAAVLWNYGVTRTTSARAGLFLYLEPLVSVTGGAFFLHERISFVTLASGALIIAGVMLAQVRRVLVRAEERDRQSAVQQQ
ncbi:MAG TPA: EamA family transporter [Ktedonobacteraceae bacterium]